MDTTITNPGRASDGESTRRAGSAGEAGRVGGTVSADGETKVGEVGSIGGAENSLAVGDGATEEGRM
jgi:hypothetical protein